MIVAVTGGTGFIGSKLCARLAARGDVVRLLTRRPETVANSASLEAYRCDLLTVGIAELATVLDGVEVLYHCAGQLQDEGAMRALHVAGTRKLIEAAAGRVGHWVQLSSVGVYGPRVSGTVTEESELNPQGAYETTKCEADLLVLEAAKQGLFSCTILRPSNVYGAGMSNRSLYGLIETIGRGRFFFIGKPGASANYIHVDNVVEALLMCGTNPQAVNRIYNLSDYRTLEQFVAFIAAALGKTGGFMRLPEWPIRLAARVLGTIPGFPLTASRVRAMTGRAVYTKNKIEGELGYRHVISMEAGVAELVESWRQGRGPGRRHG